MAQLLYSFVIAYFFFVLPFIVAFNSKHDYPELKSLQFTLYQHNTFNKSGYIIVNGVDTGEATSQYSSPFGSLLAFRDPLTLKPNGSCKVIGFMEGFIVTSSLDGLQTVGVVKISLRLMNHTGSISVVGGAPNLAPGDLTVVGGTGDFMFVQGVVTASPFDLSYPNFVYENEFHLYWPPYAT